MKKPASHAAFWRRRGTFETARGNGCGDCGSNIAKTVNPNTDEVAGHRCYHDLRSIPEGVDAVVIGTRPEVTEETMRECAGLGIKHVWMHRGPGTGSVSKAAAQYGRQHGITVIDGGCPCMFDPTADVGHKIMRFMFTLTSNVPRSV